MADLIQRGQSSFGTTDTSITLTAGTEYTAPTDGFFRIVGALAAGDGQTGNFSGEIDRNWVVITNPGNIGTSITLTRPDAGSTEAVNVQWEVWDLSALSGNDSATVLGVELLSMASGTETVDSSTFTPTDDNDVVVIITSQGSDATQSFTRNESDEVSHTAEWVAASNLARLTRLEGGTSDNASDVSIAVIEFTGSNWTVERVAHTFVAADTDETETLSNTLSATTEAFLIDVQTQQDGQGAQEMGVKAWISSTTQLTFHAEDLGAGLGKSAVAWVVQNSGLTTQHVSGTRAASAGSSPDTWTETVTAVSDTARTAVTGVCCTTNTNSDSHYGLMGARLTASTTVTLSRGNNNSERDYRFSVVEFPAAAGANPAPTRGGPRGASRGHIRGHAY